MTERKQLKNNITAETMSSDNSITFKEEGKLQVGALTLNPKVSSQVGRSVCSVSQRCTKDGLVYVQFADKACYIDPKDEAKSIALVPEPHGDCNLFTLPVTEITAEGACKEAAVMMHKADKLLEEVKRQDHLEHLKEQHTTKHPACKSCDEGLMTRIPSRTNEDGVRESDENAC